MSRFRRVCVFCASSSGHKPEYELAARQTGKLLAERGIGLVYGGAKVGLMGALADACLEAGGNVLGVLPRSLVEREVAHVRLTELLVVESMHARKTIMAHMSDAFMALPGGWGTMEETFEIVTWAQLGYHAKPVGLVNLAGYYDSILSFADRAVAEGLLSAPNRALLTHAATPVALLDQMEGAR